MKVIEIINEWTAPRWIDDAGTGMRNMSTSVIRGVNSALGRGARFQKAEDLAPQIADLAKTKGRPLTTDEIAKHISDSHPGLVDELADATKVKQEQLDFDYQKALDAWNNKPARSRTPSTKPQYPPPARLTNAEETAIRSKPEYQPDPKLVKDVESKANSLTSKANQAEALKNLAPVAKWTERLVRYGIEAAVVAQVLAPFSEYYSKLNRAKEYYDSGQMPNTKDMPKDIKTLAEWYIWYTDAALGDAILKSGAIFIAAIVARKSFRWLGGIAKVFAGDTVGAWIGGLTGSAATAIFLSWGFDEGMDKYWGSVFANLIDIPQLHINAARVVGAAVNSHTGYTTQSISSSIMEPVASIARWFRELVGLTNGSDAFVDKSDGKTTSPSASGQPANAPAAAGTVTTPAAAGTVTTPAAAGTVTAPAEIEKRNTEIQSGKDVDSSGKAVAPTASGQAVPAAASIDKKAAQQGFTDLGGGWLEDPKTGKIYPKIQESR